jgi:hypothetical protein
MIPETEARFKVIKYAEKNNYTILANTFGALEYVKYEFKDGVNNTVFLKWPKGGNEIMISKNKKTKKINLSEL